MINLEDENGAKLQKVSSEKRYPVVCGQPAGTPPALNQNELACTVLLWHRAWAEAGKQFPWGDTVLSFLTARELGLLACCTHNAEEDAGP